MRITAKTIFEKKVKHERISALTAYDFPFAQILDQTGIDIILVGDSLGMVLLGYDTTLPVTMQDMLHHVRAASKAVKKALVVADMPFGSYKTPEIALRNAKLFLKAGAQAVKLEGGKKIEKQIKALIKTRIPVMGHLGMTPQSVDLLGGYRVQGRDKKQAAEIEKDAEQLERWGVFAFVLECVPASLASKITHNVKCPVIGIGAGNGTDGQVLVLHDMLGFQSSVHPRFVRKYTDLDRAVRNAVQKYRRDVLTRKFPSKEESY